MPAWAADAGWANIHDVMPEPRRLSGVNAYAGDVTGRTFALGKGCARGARVFRVSFRLTRGRASAVLCGPCARSTLRRPSRGATARTSLLMGAPCQSCSMPSFTPPASSPRTCCCCATRTRAQPGGGASTSSGATIRAAFEDYQSRQKHGARRRFERRYWASFVGAPHGETLFAGLYRVGPCRPTEADWVAPHSGVVVPAGHDNIFALTSASELQDVVGLLYVEWGPGTRSWVQLAERQDKPIVELRRAFKEPEFPGYAAFMTQLSELENLPASWATALAACRGVYLLTCPRSNEQYVGAAHGGDGFLGRWFAYVRSGHGGNVGLKSRDPSDYRVSILEVAGSAASVEDILAMEGRWKAKLQSREMGLNRN